MTIIQLEYLITVASSNSINEAANKLFISQPTLSAAIKEIESTVGFSIFNRSNRGVKLTLKGEEFVTYAKQVLDQYNLLEEKFVSKNNKQYFSVSLQHYTFAVKAFVETLQSHSFDQYEFSIFETRTKDVIDNVKNFKSDLGVIYTTANNERIITKILNDANLEFVPLVECALHVYLHQDHPLATLPEISLDMLDDYPCCVFDQGDNSLFLAEEVISIDNNKKIIKVSDRATILNLMIGLNGYTICSGIISQELNGSEYLSIPLAVDETMTIGYIKHKNLYLNEISQEYIGHLKDYLSQ